MAMTHAHESADRPALTPLSALFTQYLQRQAAAEAEGLNYPEPGDEVVPHEAVPVQPVDPQLAWNDAVAAVPRPHKWQVPPEWPTLVTGQPPAVDLAFCLGNFPQMVRNLHPLLNAGDLTALRGLPGQVAVVTELERWAEGVRRYPDVLLAAGVLRLARHFDAAAVLLNRAEVPAEWRAAHANETAALAWHRGEVEQAAALWQAQEASVPVLFNRGMAALFLGRPAEARDALTRAVAQLPETSAWHHLGQLYLALAATRS
jgi:hypothetical protein